MSFYLDGAGFGYTRNRLDPAPASKRKTWRKKVRKRKDLHLDAHDRENERTGLRLCSEINSFQQVGSWISGRWHIYKLVFHIIISFEFDCFKGLWTRIYEFTPPPSLQVIYLTTLPMAFNYKIGQIASESCRKMCRKYFAEFISERFDIPGLKYLSMTS